MVVWAVLRGLGDLDGMDGMDVVGGREWERRRIADGELARYVRREGAGQKRRQAEVMECNDDAASG
jgi:hypothetical protein